LPSASAAIRNPRDVDVVPAETVERLAALGRELVRERDVLVPMLAMKSQRSTDTDLDPTGCKARV
jgi:hypothetical protein